MPPTPFHFHARLSLSFATGRRARTLRDLRNGLAELPMTVVYQHTHRFLWEHQSLVPEPPHDFALWVTDVLRDRTTGEHLAAVDPLRMSSLDALREELLALLDEGLRRGEDRAAPPGEEFHFLTARRFSLATPYRADTLAAFADALRRVSMSSLYLHLFEAKLRPPLGINDFSQWFRQALGEDALAQAVADLDLYRHTLEDLRREILALVQKRVEVLSHAAS